MRVVYYVAASLDGRIADADGKVDWLDPYGSEELDFHGFFNRVGAVVMGRRTYQFILDHGSWPYGDLPGVILTHSPLPDFDAPVRAYDGDLSAVITELKAETDKDIWIVGGGEVAGQFLGKGLLDEVEVYTIPVLLGAGPGLFGEHPPAVNMTVNETTAFSNGVVKTVYKV